MPLKVIDGPFVYKHSQGVIANNKKMYSDTLCIMLDITRRHYETFSPFFLLSFVDLNISWWTSGRKCLSEGISV